MNGDPKCYKHDDGTHVYTRWNDGVYRCHWCGLRHMAQPPIRERWTYQGVDTVAGIRYYLWIHKPTGRKFGWQADHYKRRTTR